MRKYNIFVDENIDKIYEINPDLNPLYVKFMDNNRDIELHFDTKEGDFLCALSEQKHDCSWDYFSENTKTSAVAPLKTIDKKITNQNLKEKKQTTLIGFLKKQK